MYFNNSHDNKHEHEQRIHVEVGSTFFSDQDFLTKRILNRISLSDEKNIAMLSRLSKCFISRQVSSSILFKFQSPTNVFFPIEIFAFPFNF